MKGVTVYRIRIIENILGHKFYCIESKKNLFSGWRYVFMSLHSSLKEVSFLKKLLEMGEHNLSIFKPSARYQMLTGSSILD